MEYTLDEKRAAEAYEKLVSYLAVCQRSEKECRDKLYEKGFHKNEVEFAIEKAKGYKYIDDEEYVRNYLFFNKQRYGVKKIAYKLETEKGVDKGLVKNVIADNIDDDFEIEKCLDFARKYVARKHIEDRSQAQKLSAFLYQKGFEWRVINKVVDKLFDIDFEIE